MGMTAIVLGAAAGGGFPQWNCNCEVCRLAWAGDKRVRARTQASLAISASGRRWTILNASPDLRAQIQATPALQPSGLRDSPIESVVLTGAEIDQTAGLLSLRERSPLRIIATATTLAAVAGNPMFGALAPDVVSRRAVTPGEKFALADGLQAELFMVPGKVPLYLEGENPETAEESAANVGIEITDGSKRVAYVPGAAAVTASLRQRLARADVILFDGTLFSDDEMIRAGTGTKAGRRMGHMPVSGEGGSLAALQGLSVRKIFVHINNTNPILIDGSLERSTVEAAGWAVAEDGMEIVL
jgi:pyrroloquinoline quinone biosynthesis protein B